MPKNIGKGSGGGGAGTQPPKSAAPAGGAVTPGNPAPPTPTGVLQAFAASPGIQDNNVNLVELRQRLGGTRAEQDAAIRGAWERGIISLDSYENLAVAPGSPRFAAINRDSFYVSPRPEGHDLANFKGPDGRWYQQRLSLVSKGRNYPE